MASPRSFWSGSISLGLLNVPVTLGKASEVTREKGISNVCRCDKGAPHKIDRSERCPLGGEILKGKAVEMTNGEFHLLTEQEIEFIESSTKLDNLEVLDVQPLDEFPWDYATGSYYVRPDKKSKAAMQPFKILFEALHQERMGLVVKLTNSSTQKLGVIGVHEGVMMLAVIPFHSDIREPGEDELSHENVSVDEKAVRMCADLLKASHNENGFQWADYSDEGLKLRQEAVDRVLEGHTEPVPEAQAEPVADIMQQLAESIREQQEKV